MGFNDGMTRQDIRQAVRDGLHESVADLWTDAEINRHINEEIRSLPAKGVYLEAVNDGTLAADSYTFSLTSLDSSLRIIEDIWQNNGTATDPDWGPFLYDYTIYNNTLYIKNPPTDAIPIRVFSQDGFTELSTDTATITIPNDTVEVVTVGVVLRCYRSLMAYLMNSNNLDLGTRPNSVSASQAAQWVAEVKKDYKELLQGARRVPKPREINLVF